MEGSLQELLVKESRYFLIYTGRQLNLSKSFADELVEDESELLFIDNDLIKGSRRVYEDDINLEGKIFIEKPAKIQDGAILCPGRFSVEDFKPKRPTINQFTAPGEPELESAPPNIIKKINNPKGVTPDAVKLASGNTQQQA